MKGGVDHVRWRGLIPCKNLILFEDFKDIIPHSVRVHLDDLDDSIPCKYLILFEDFKDIIPHSVRVHLDDLDVVDMQTAARKADDYAVTHKLSTPNRKEVAHGRGHRAKFGRNTDTRAETGDR